MSNQDPLRIALLNFAYWPEVRRGNERLVHDLAVGLVGRGHEARIITSHPGRPSRTVEEGVPIVRHWRPPDRLLRLRRFQDHLTHLPFAYGELRLGNDDIAHAFFPSDALAARGWSRSTGRPFAFTATGMPQRSNVSNLRLRKQILEAIVADASALIVLSEAAREAAWRWLGVEARVIHPGVDLGRFTPGRRDEAPTIACAATPDDPRKRVDLLVAAFARVRRELPSARLLLIAPADPATHRELAAIEGIELLAADEDVTADMFRRAWVGVLPSLQEAFGMVLVESLACGTPVVGARDGAIPEIIDRPEVGRLFDGGDERDVARALIEALELSEDDGTSESCRKRAEDFSNERAARAHEALYREVLSA